jgi:SAM-dependent MidA family methyltransferase
MDPRSTSNPASKPASNPASDPDRDRSDLSEMIAGVIDDSGGSITFERFMDLALYAPGGFYAETAAGRRGDFLTSPEVGPLFGVVVARFIAAEWQRLGRPEAFSVIDVGAGPGTLARSVGAALVISNPQCAAAVTYWLVETSAAQRQRHPDTESPVRVRSTAEVPAGPIVGVVIANELLDNLAFRLVVNDGGWREASVVARSDGTFAEVLGPMLDPRPEVLPAKAPHGARAPLQSAAGRWLDQLLSQLDRGVVLVIDYAVPRTAELAMRPYRDWLRTFRGHERGEHYLVRPGTQDITCEIALDQFPEPDAVRSQAQWLQRWGIDELVEEGRRFWIEHAAHPDLEAMRMRSRIAESEALLDPSGLGGFIVAEWRR